MSLKSKRMRGTNFPYPIKLFYTSNISIILQTAIVSNLYIFSYVLHRRFKGNFLIGFIGKWQEIDMSGASAPASGLAYYISPPRAWYDISKNP